jgi:hypothetical protein
VLLEPKGPPAVDADRLEGGAPTEEGLVVGMERGLARVDEAAPSDRKRENAHVATGSGTRPPTALRSGRAFTHDSSISASGSESHTMPPPTQR